MIFRNLTVFKVLNQLNFEIYSFLNHNRFLVLIEKYCIFVCYDSIHKNAHIAEVFKKLFFEEQNVQTSDYLLF